LEKDAKYPEAGIHDRVQGMGGQACKGREVDWLGGAKEPASFQAIEDSSTAFLSTYQFSNQTALISPHVIY
jgi:hypothetical protein